MGGMGPSAARGKKSGKSRGPGGLGGMFGNMTESNVQMVKKEDIDVRFVTIFDLLF